MANSKFFRTVRSLEKRVDNARWGSEPRELTNQDYEAWEDAAKERVAPKNLPQIQAALTRINPLRVKQMQRDMRWLEKQAVKLGINPEDARWIL